MKKIYLALILVLGTSLYGQAQKAKVDLDPFSFNYEHVELPDFYTEPANRTYNVVTNNGSDYQWIFDNSAFSRKININGFKQADAGAYVNIEVMLENLIVENGGVKEVTSKKSDGTTVVTGYTAIINCRGLGKCIVNYGGRVTTIPLSYTQAIKKDYPNQNDAYRYYYDNSSTLKQQFSREFATKSIDKMFADLNSMYGYRVSNPKGSLWVLMSKDNPDFQGHQDALKKIQDAFAPLYYTSDPLPVYEQLQPVIKYYEDLIKTYSDPEDKKHRKMRYASYFNMMNIYYALDLPEKAKAAADALFANDYDKGDGKSMADRASKLAKSLDTNKATHRHFAIDPLYVR